MKQLSMSLSQFLYTQVRALTEARVISATIPINMTLSDDFKVRLRVTVEFADAADVDDAARLGWDATPAGSAAVSAIKEVSAAMLKYPTWPTDPLHALAVLGEEYGELTKAVLQTVYEPGKSTVSDVREEAIQTAAMALRFIASLDAYEYRECHQHNQAAKPV